MTGVVIGSQSWYFFGTSYVAISWRRKMRQASIFLCFLSLQACCAPIGGQASFNSSLVTDGLDRAIVVARHEYQTKYSQEYSIATWDVETINDKSSWVIFFAMPKPHRDISDDPLDIMLDAIERRGRMFIVSKSDYRIIETMLM